MNQTEDKKRRFSAIALEHFSALRRFAFSLCKNDFATDDLVSATILKAFENFTRIKDENKIKSWLFKILSNQFISDYRASRKFMTLNNIETSDTGSNSESFSLFETIAKSDFTTDGNPEKRIISKLTQKQIEEAINDLQDEYRVTLVLCDMEGFSYDEISKIIGIPIGTVRSRIARARAILQKKLWLQAKELGIKTSKTRKLKKEYTCTCGGEETLIHESANSKLII